MIAGARDGAETFPRPWKPGKGTPIYFLFPHFVIIALVAHDSNVALKYGLLFIRLDVLVRLASDEV